MTTRPSPRHCTCLLHALPLRGEMQCSSDMLVQKRSVFKAGILLGHLR